MQPQLPWRLCTDVAKALAGARDLQSACDAVLSALSSTVPAESIIFEARASHAVPKSRRPGATVNQAWSNQVAALPHTASFGLLDDQDHDQPVATYVVLGTDHESRLVLVMDGDWTQSAEVMEAVAAIVAGTFTHIRSRHDNDLERLTRRFYRFLLALGRARGLNAVAETAVRHTRAIFQLDRVSVAHYDEHQNALRIVASHGMPREVGQGANIRPGDWVLGHVYQSQRPLIVNTPAQLPAPPDRRARYRPGPFAVIPLLHHGQPRGVIALTNRNPAVPFTPFEQFALRALGPLLGAAGAAAQSEDENQRLRHAATVDPLTGLYNRSYLDRRLHEEVGRSRREHTQVSALMVDIDNFKAINDERGHAAGDSVLKHVGEVIRSAVRLFDVCARYGGDEFVIVMPNSDAASAQACAERIRSRTAQAVLGTEGAPVTLSVGVATNVGDCTPGELLARADRALYEAKGAGKNTIRSDDWTTATPDHPGAAPFELAAPPTLPYVLVADAHQVRRDLYRDHADRMSLGMLVARDGAQALSIMEQFGPPTVLAVDMVAPGMNGVSLLTWLHDKEAQTRVVAFSQSAALRRYLAATGQLAQLTLMKPDASAAAVELALAETVTRPGPAEEVSLGMANDTNSLVASLAPKVRQLIDAAGLAIYVKDQEHNRMHAAVSWASDSLLERAQAHLPRVAERVITSGESVLIGHVGSHGLQAADDEAGHAMVGVPIKHGGRVVGAVCAFDDGPIALADNVLSQFEELSAFPAEGSGTLQRPASAKVARPDLPAKTVVDTEWQPVLWERQRGEFEVARELARARREQRQLSVVLFDVAAAGGHGTNGDADEAMASVMDTFVRAVRPSDLPIRWSGSELLLLLSGVSSTEARAVAERVRAAMHAGGRRRVAVSGGVTEIAPHERFDDVVSRARERVMMALRRGQNRVG